MNYNKLMSMIWHVDWHVKSDKFIHISSQIFISHLYNRLNCLLMDNDH